ncbi:MAG: sulfatase [Candidatus Omnitrophota bacterium]
MKKYIYSALIILIIATTLFCYKKIQLLSRPNIIFIVLDAARADHFSCYGYSKNTTPCIDAIAKKSILFENNFSQGTRTTTSVSSIFFSRYFTLDAIEDDAYIWGIKKEYLWRLFMQFDSGQIFLTKLLSMHGYRTALFSDHAYFDKKSYFASQFDESSINNKINKNIELDRNIKINTVIPEIISFIKKNKRSFIYWHILFPHTPYPPGVENKELIGNADKETVELVRKKYVERPDDSADIFNEIEIECLKGLYDSNLKYADSLVGILYEKLKSNKLLRNTMIIITSDHGEFLGDQGLLSHGESSWDSVIKTPLILYYQKLTYHETRINEFTQSIDIMPTIFDICGIKIPQGKSLDGNSLLGYLNKNVSSRIAVFGSDYIRTKKYKYIINKDMLYDLEQDPEEKNNIAYNEPAIKKELMGMHEKTMKPYRERYDKSVRSKTPDYPFYFIATHMKLEPEDAMERCRVHYKKMPEFLNINNPSINKAWLFDTAWDSEGIYYLPAKSYLAPITLSTDILNGTYKIYLLLESSQEINSSAANFGLRFRFYKNLPFQNPARIDLFRVPNKACYYYYFYLGNIVINDKKFSIEIDFHPENEKIYLIKHIKFIPLGVSDNPVKNKDFQEKLEELKSLGYL